MGRGLGRERRTKAEIERCFLPPHTEASVGSEGLNEPGASHDSALGLSCPTDKSFLAQQFLLCRVGGTILHCPSSAVFHRPPLSIIYHPLPSILHPPSSSVLHPPSSILHHPPPPASIFHRPPPSILLCPPLSILHRPLLSTPFLGGSLPWGPDESPVPTSQDFVTGTCPEFFQLHCPGQPFWNLPKRQKLVAVLEERGLGVHAA